MGSHSLLIHFVSLSDSAIFGDGVIPYLSVPLVCVCVCSLQIVLVQQKLSLLLIPVGIYKSC